MTAEVIESLLESRLSPARAAKSRCSPTREKEIVQLVRAGLS